MLCTTKIVKHNIKSWRGEGRPAKGLAPEELREDEFQWCFFFVHFNWTGYWRNLQSRNSKGSHQEKRKACPLYTKSQERKILARGKIFQ